VVAPALVDLRRTHPQLDVELLCTDQYVDLIADGIDVAIRLGRLADSNYRAVKLGSFVKWVVASPEFIGKWGPPRTPADLPALPFCALTVLPRPLTLDLRRSDDGDGDGEAQSVRCENAFLTNTADACRAATLAGGGFGLLTDFSCSGDLAAGRLIRLLPQWATESASIQAVFPPTSHPPAKVRALIDTLKQRLAGAP
jgi:DNA-binding transcriptional LysR family regulator